MKKYIIRAILLIICTVCTTACGGKDTWPRVPCADVQSLVDIIGEEYILPIISDETLEKWSLEIFYRTRWDVKYNEKVKYAHGYEYALTPKFDDSPINDISLRGMIDEYEHDPSSSYSGLRKKKIFVNEIEIEYNEHFAKETDLADREVLCIYASCLREDGIRYAIEIRRNTSIHSKNDYQDEICEYFRTLFAQNDVASQSPLSNSIP